MGISKILSNAQGGEIFIKIINIRNSVLTPTEWLSVS